MHRLLTRLGCTATATLRPCQIGENWLSQALTSSLTLSLFSLFFSPVSLLSVSIPLFSTPGARSQISNLGVQRWNCSERSASGGVASPALHSERLRLADCNCLYLRSQPQGSVACRLSHALSLGPLRLCFLLGLSSY